MGAQINTNKQYKLQQVEAVTSGWVRITGFLGMPNHNEICILQLEFHSLLPGKSIDVLH